ncbi:glycoside hydrolase family 10 protein [Pleomorphovibrio marinus]|uniref:glycoside hydrolase family 10 protein n=1 Tax=Pleomorphovibrio marinus TaxID=2164132 RepID=UPI001E4CB760|nr:family 10 glycosylhydrolase [Pleomorphovibrio marinus]
MFKEFGIVLCKLKMALVFLLLMVIGGGEAVAKRNNSPIRGVWLTNVASDVLHSRDNIRKAVARCQANGINTLFMVTWNKGYTQYPSEVTMQYFGEHIDPKYKGRDPLQEVIEEAEAVGIAVHAWFEYGFAASYHQGEGGKILEKFPHWAARDYEGNLLDKNGFQWLNAFHPEVQDFMIQLVMEVVSNYGVAGVQGDDRLPALPSTGGYDDYTVSVYQKEHRGNTPPSDHLDEEWVQWRADKLSDFWKKLYGKVKHKKPRMTVSSSPSVYPWSKEEYLQDWPKWIKEGYVDLVIPQVYRYEEDAYIATFLENLNWVPEGKKHLFVPGVLLKVGDYLAPKEFLETKVALHRENGVFGEVFFFYEGLPLQEGFFESYGKD